MKLFIDTANVEHIREFAEIGVISGVTTNPTLIAKEGRDFNEVIKEITSIVDGPISGEVISLKADGMIKEGIEISKIHPNMVVKIPMTEEGLKATKKLSSMNAPSINVPNMGTFVLMRKRVEKKLEKYTAFLNKIDPSESIRMYETSLQVKNDVENYTAILEKMDLEQQRRKEVNKLKENYLDNVE